MDKIRLLVKKELLENIKHHNEVTFEASPFYFSRFTGSKKNTIDDLKNDSSILKHYDVVEFTIGGESLVFNVIEIGLNDNDEFFIKYDNNVSEPESTENVEDVETVDIEHVQQEQIEEIVNEEPEPVVETIPEVFEEIEDEHVQEETNENNVKYILNEFFNQRNVYPLHKNWTRIGYLGRIDGCEKRIQSRNEHPVRVDLESRLFSISNLKCELDEMSRGKHVFVNINDFTISEETDSVKLFLKVYSQLEVHQWAAR